MQSKTPDTLRIRDWTEQAVFAPVNCSELWLDFINCPIFSVFIIDCLGYHYYKVRWGTLPSQVYFPVVSQNGKLLDNDECFFKGELTKDQEDF